MIHNRISIYVRKAKQCKPMEKVTNTAIAEEREKVHTVLKDTQPVHAEVVKTSITVQRAGTGGI